MPNFQPAQVPTFYFIGVTTGQSSIMRVFPKWGKALGLNAIISGIDLPLHAPPEQYRETVDFLKHDPLSLGALVTTHKLDLFKACRAMFDYIDPYAEQLEEVSSLSKYKGKFAAHAKDPISSGLALEAFVPPNFWADHGGEVLLLGAGGSSLAMSLYFAQEKFKDNAPGRITIANRSQPRLDSARAVLGGLDTNIEFRFVHGPSPADNDALVAALPPYSLVVNATGLGKDAPGSPTTGAVSYPQNSLVWEINYRGDLIFMYQAQAQAKEKNLHVEDGWDYFIHGWTQVIAEVFHTVITRERLEELSRIARET
ncbi:MAG: shikimate dehydrogenase [Treponema sp.]|jgi:shikimate 5-dehydrogenase|nr:shikimate dehydrogenase [Treponema sp.]